jgi:membrane protein
MQAMARSWWLLKRALVATYEHGGLRIAKSAAYSALLSFVPVLTVLATILVQLNAERVSQTISKFLFVVVPPGSEDLVQYSFTARGERPVHLLVLASIVSLWAASGLTATLMEGFQAAYHLPRGRPFLKQRGVAILLVVGAAAPVLLASSLLLVGGRAERWALGALGFIAAGEQLRGGVLVAGTVLRYLVAFGAIVLSSAGLYYFGPNRRQQWKHIWPGAIIATTLWLLATVAFAWYVRNIANYNVMYGSVGAVIAMLVWMYVLSVIALIGCEYNAEHERLEKPLKTS